MSLQGKIAVVTGASRGLGQRVAFTLAEQGIRVALVARSERLLHEAVQQINAKGGIASAGFLARRSTATASGHAGSSKRAATIRKRPPISSSICWAIRPHW